ncbi:MAG: antitoxin [Actinomycetota bacterium]
MRTTVSIDPDLAATLKRIAQTRGITFKEALNASLRAGLGVQTGSPRRYRLRPRSMGLRPGIDLDKALRLAGAMEDAETLRELELRK